MKISWQSKAEQDKIVKLKTHDLSYFLGKMFFRDEGFHDIFVYQTTLSLLIKKRQGH